MRESRIEDYLVRRVREAGGEIRKVRWLGRNGAPDRMVFLPNRIPFFVELKAPGEGLGEHQKREHKRMRISKMRIEVIDSFAGVDGLFQ